jgi:hypothetical protein
MSAVALLQEEIQKAVEELQTLRKLLDDSASGEDAGGENWRPVASRHSQCGECYSDDMMLSRVLHELVQVRNGKWTEKRLTSALLAE